MCRCLYLKSNQNNLAGNELSCPSLFVVHESGRLGTRASHTTVAWRMEWSFSCVQELRERRWLEQWLIGRKFGYYQLLFHSVHLNNTVHVCNAVYKYMYMWFQYRCLPSLIYNTLKNKQTNTKTEKYLNCWNVDLCESTRVHCMSAGGDIEGVRQPLKIPQRETYRGIPSIGEPDKNTL